jgi:predicted phage-related endonuclease
MNRKGFIGGSDCVKIMNGEWYELWQVKTGRAEPEDLSNNLPVQLGTFTEDFNLQWFEKQHNVVLAAHQKEFISKVGEVPVKGTIDAGVRGERNIVEAKHTNAFTNMDEQIGRYMPQIQLYCHLANCEGAYLSVIFGNSKWESAHVAYDEEYFNSMWAVVSDFWGYVLRDEEPIGIDTPKISINQIKVDDMVVRDATLDNQFVDAAVTYVNGIEHNRTFENAKKQLKAMVADNEREVYCDYITIKRDKRGALRITKRN